MKELVIAPSILSLDYSRTSEQLKELDESNAKWMHFDVMDGKFCTESDLWTGPSQGL